MSVEALFTVLHEGKPYQVEVSYEPHDFVARIKGLIFAELKSEYPPSFDNAAWGWLTLKTLDGHVIMEDEMPEGKKFLAELTVPKSYLKSSIIENAVNSEELWIKKLKNASLFQTEPSNPLFFPSSDLPLDQSYLNLKKTGDGTFESPTFFVISPAGSGKSKLIVDLALVKNEYVIYIDCRKLSGLFDSIKQYIFNKEKFSSGVRFMFQLLHKFQYCSTLLVMESIVKTSEEFFRYWAGQDASKLVWILDAVIPSDRQCSTSFIFAFDECQELLGSDDGVIQGLKSSDTDQEICSSHTSIFALLIRSRRIFGNTRFVFSGTSLRLSIMTEEASLLRKNLHVILRPPLFDEQVAEKYLVLNQVDKNVANIASTRLVGRALASRYFIDAYKQEEKSLDDNLVRFGVSNLIKLKVEAILNRVLERVKNYFLKHIDQLSLSVQQFFALPVQVGASRMTRQEVLVDLMNNEEVVTMKPRNPRNRDNWELYRCLEIIGAIFLPIEETHDGFRYHCRDLLAFQAMVEILSSIEPNVAVEADLARHADAFYRLALERRTVSGISGEFIVESLFKGNCGKRLGDLVTFSHLNDFSEFANSVIKIDSVDTSASGFNDVLCNMDFTTLCISVDTQTRFDFMLLLDNQKDKAVIACFGEAKLYSSSIQWPVFCDSILSTDPSLAYLSTSRNYTNPQNKGKFLKIWKDFETAIKASGKSLKTLMILFAYPHPVGTIEYRDVYSFDADKLAYFIGTEKVQSLCEDIGTFPVDQFIACLTGKKTVQKRAEANQPLSLESGMERVKRLKTNTK